MGTPLMSSSKAPPTAGSRVACPDVAPQGLVHCLLVRPGITTVGFAYVLVVDEELIEAREPAHPSDAEEAWRRSRSERRNEPCEVPQRERSPSPFSQAAPRTGQDKPGASEVVALAQDQVRGEIAGRPRREESRCLGTELTEQVAELCSLDGVEERIGHIAGVYRRQRRMPVLLSRRS